MAWKGNVGIISFAVLDGNLTNRSEGFGIEDVVGEVGAEAQNLDHVLWFIGRVIEAAILALFILLIVVCVKYRHVIKAAIGPKLAMSKDACRWRKIRRCLVHCCCCRSCSPGGFQELGPSDVLVVTFVCASDIPHGTTFFFKTWTEPIDGPQKLSRIHRDVAGSCDLGSERIQLDWYGDEDLLVVQALTPRGVPGGSKDILIGETRIPLNSIVKYANLSKQSGTGNDAIRLFPLYRSAHNAPPGIATSGVDPLAIMVVNHVQTTVGMEPVDPDEVAQLREENKALRSQLTRYQPGIATTFRSNSSKHDDKKEASKVRMNVALKFEINEIVRQPIDASVYRTSSRDMERMVHVA